MKSPDIYIGTAGWSYDDWVPSFYPKKQSASFDWLKFYAEYFNTVEVNATYYKYLNPAVFKAWVRKTEDSGDFLFTVKLHQDFTHKRRYGKDQVNGFLYNVETLKEAERLGGLLFQFPYSFGYDQANLEYLRELVGHFEGYDKFIEVRHNSWENAEAHGFMRDNDLTFCIIDQPGLGSSIEFSPIVTNDTAYIRFHGRNDEGWLQSIKNFGKPQNYEDQSDRYRYFYSPGELFDVSRKIKEVFDRVKKVFIIMNNHPAGYAVANAFELLHIIKDLDKVKVPDTVTTAFPRIKKIAAGGGQQDLFS